VAVRPFGAVFARRLVESLTAHLPVLVRADFFVAITPAVTGVFWLVVPAAGIVFLLAWLIKEVLLRGRAPVAKEPVPPELVS
jgi:hypothetical protein